MNERLSIGSRIGQYEILEAIGRGGMGIVFRAYDTKLRRDVAIKVLPDHFADDRERLTRFKREAQTLASLNHPNIAQIYGLEESDHVPCIIMEMVEGTTLADRLGNGPLPLKEALTIATGICEAIEAAHEKGILHRDLKPANVKITADGKPKLLDFGLAKAFRDDATGMNFTEMPTGTHEGMILGTPAYMSPEQARGQKLDRRADIWAFGCVLYEMMTGRRTFQADTLSDTIAAILGREPDWNALPAGLPPNIRRVLQRSLEKDTVRRLRDIGDARIELEEEASGTRAKTSSSHGGFWRKIGAAVLLVLIGAATGWYFKAPPERSPELEGRFVLPIPSDVRFVGRGVFGSNVVISPDGLHLAFLARRGTTSQLYLRSIQSAETKALPGTEDATHSFFSPDSRWLAFFAGGKLKKIPVDGGLPVAICDAPSSRGGFWGENGKIVFSPEARGTGIFQVSADGGAAEQITKLDIAKGETSHRLPELLPGNETVLFTAYGATYQDVSIVAQSLKTGRRQLLIDGASQPHYVPTGHLLYVQPKLPGTIMAVSFDPENLKLTGTPVPVMDNVLTDRGDSSAWSLSRSGVLVYAAGGLQEPTSSLVFVDRAGVETSVGAPAERPYNYPRISPDGHQLVFTLSGIQGTLWTYDLSSHVSNRLTFEGNNSWAVWTPDGKRITYASNQSEAWRLFWKPFDGSTKEELLLAVDKGAQAPHSWSPDGKVLLYQDSATATRQDIWMLSIDGGRRARPFLQSPAAEVDARFSPDGRWVAYASDETGRLEVYVVSSSGAGDKKQISTEGGREPVWAHNGHELFFRTGEKMMVAEFATEPSFRAATARLLFEGPYLRTTTHSPEYDVALDDQHLLMVKPSEEKATAQFNVVLNWFSELKRRAPAR
jgi:serine/threonine-protein kinase